MPKVGVGLPLALVIVVPRLPMYLTMNGSRGTTVHARLSLQGDVSLFSGPREFIDCPTLQSLSSRKDMSDLEAFGSIWLCSFAVRPSQTPSLLSSCRSGAEGMGRRSWRHPVRPWKRSCDWQMLGLNDKAIADASNGVLAFGWFSVQGVKFINSKQVSV